MQPLHSDAKVRNGAADCHFTLTFAMTQDIVKNVAETHIASAGPANQGGWITASTFVPNQRIVIDARGQLIATGDVTRSRQIITENYGGGGTTTDASGTLISTEGGGTSSSVEVMTISGTPPPGWKPFFTPSRGA